MDTVNTVIFFDDNMNEKDIEIENLKYIVKNLQSKYEKLDLILDDLYKILTTEQKEYYSKLIND